MSATDPHDIDARAWQQPPRYESTIPFYIGEWDCVLKPLGKSTEQQYRFVTIYGLTGTHDADDASIGGNHHNVVDRETMYQLDEYFAPWDLYSAVEKETKRWVEFTFGTSYTTLRRPVKDVLDSEWDQYCTFSERVIDMNTSTLLNRWEGDYNFRVDGDGYGQFTNLPNSTHYYKILYSTEPDVTAQRVKTVSTPVAGPEYNKTLGQYVTVSARTLADSWTDNIGVGHTFTTTFDAMNVYPRSLGASNWTESWTLQKMWNETDFKVFLGETYVSTMPDIIEPFNVTGTYATFIFDIDNLQKTVTATSADSVIHPLPEETIHVVYLNHTLNVTVLVAYNNYTDANGVYLNSTVTATFTTRMTIDYEDKLNGRYEWGVVGRDADSVDSAGLALVSAALKNKQVEYGLAGEDMYAPVDGSGNAVNQMPFVMSKIGSGTSWANYYYGTSDFRVALRDDWCHAGTVSGDEWPIASSNMIGVGGPLANMLAYYGNDFTDALFGLDQFTNFTAWENQIVPLTCWNATSDSHTYVSNNTIGYAVISTYKDINGTVLFLIWGHWGRDTYYVTKWFHEEGVYQLQQAPRGVTSIIVKIDYESTSEGYKPIDTSIVEVLGTISERLWIHGSEYKGGIHDP